MAHNAAISGASLPRPVACAWQEFFGYLFDASNKKFLLIGMYFDAELISEVDVNLGTP